MTNTQKLIGLCCLMTASISYAGTGLNCSKVDNMGDNEASACVAQTDSELNGAYQQLMKRLKTLPNDNVAKSLKKSEKDWLAFRQSHCEMVLDLGSASTAKQRTLDACISKMNIERTAQLEAL